MKRQEISFPVLVGYNTKEISKASYLGECDYCLAKAATNGDLGAFEQLFEIHRRRVYSLCLRMVQNMSEAEDLTQDVFIQLYRKIASFRGDLPFTTWLHRLTVNQVLIHYRKRKVKFEKTSSGDGFSIVSGSGEKTSI